MAQRDANACNEFFRLPVGRRAMLAAGALGLGGYSLGELMAAQSLPQHASAGAARSFGRARSCIMLFQFGGPSHLDTFDPKPHAPAEIRGDFRTIATANRDARFCEHLPRLAALADRFALVHGVNHDHSSHNPGAYYSLTGRRPLNPSVTANAAATDFPAPGAVLDFLRKDRPDVPTAVSLPTMIADGPFRTPGEFAGFLGKKHDPLFITQDPNSKDFSVEQLTLPGGVSIGRLARRRQVLAELAKTTQLSDNLPPVRGMDAHQQRAFDLLTSPATERALTISQERADLRERYGRNPYGQSVLLARRLVEAGVRFVTVYYSAGIGGWDTHKNNFATLRDSRLPHTDLAVSALLDDLQQRGLLDETLVFWTGDFGRTPKINSSAGRDHWPQCQTVLLAGGGVPGGATVGRSDRFGAFPLSDPHKPDDVMATVYHLLGIDPATILHDQLGRPQPVADAKPIEALRG